MCVVGEPVLQAGADVRRHRFGLVDGHDGRRDFRYVQRVDDADPAAGGSPRYGLGMKQAGIHLRGFVEEEHLEQCDGLLGVLVLPVDGVGGGQGRHGVTHVAKHHAVGREIVRVGLSVAADVRQAIRLVRIGPPVVAIGIEIVRSAFAELGRELGDRDRRDAKGPIGQPEDALPVKSRDLQRMLVTGRDRSCGLRCILLRHRQTRPRNTYDA